MSNEVVASFFELLKRAGNVLILTRAQPTIDGLSTALAWQQVLKNLNKKVTVVTAGPVPPRLNFLPGVNEIKHDLPSTQSLLIDVAIKDIPLEGLKYEINNGQLTIQLTPKSGSLQQTTVTSRSGQLPYDLILAVDSPTRESWGKIFEQHRNFLLHAPTVTIDNHPSHQRYGQLNIIDITASSLAELTLKILQDHHEPLIDADLATCLYTGLVAGTNKFSTPKVTPQLLKTASDLLTSGARREEIMNALYKHRSVATLRLWGKALTSLTWDDQQKIAWTSLNRQQLIDSGATETDIADIVSELVNTSPQADVAVLFYERQAEQTLVYMAAAGPLDAWLLSQPFEASGDNDLVIFTINKNLAEVQLEIIDYLKINLAKGGHKS